jgi:hypothetical protein
MFCKLCEQTFTTSVLQVIRKAATGFALTHLAEPLYSVLVSIVLGILYGICIGRIMAMPARQFNAILRHLPQGIGNKWVSVHLFPEWLLKGRQADTLTSTWNAIVK